MSTISQSTEERRSYKQGGCVYLLNDEAKTAWIVKGPRIGRRRRYRLPEYVMVEGERYVIESIEMAAFGKAKCLKHLVIPDSIAYIDEYNFSSLPRLRSIYIGKGLEYVSSWIFHNNRKLRSFVISNDNPFLTVEHGIVYRKDANCAITTPFHRKHITVKEGTKEIFSTAFWWNKNLKSITFPSTLKKIDDNGVANCENLKEVILPEGFEECALQCFWGCTSLQLADLPSTTKELEHESFHDCPNLRALIIRCPELLLPHTCGDEPMDLPPCCTLYVPSHLVESYRQHPLWSSCKDVKSIDDLSGYKR